MLQNTVHFRNYLKKDFQFSMEQQRIVQFTLPFLPNEITWEETILNSNRLFIPVSAKID